MLCHFDSGLRDRRTRLTSVKGHDGATVNAYLAPIRAIVRTQGRTLKVKGVKQVQKPVEALDARDLGRLINAVDGPQWSVKRNAYWRSPGCRSAKHRHSRLVISSWGRVLGSSW